MTATRRAVLAALAAGALAGCDRAASRTGDLAAASPGSDQRRALGPVLPRPVLPGTVRPAAPSAPPLLTRAQVVARFGHLKPHTWGFGGPRVVRGLGTSRRVIALTFDACGGYGGGGLDTGVFAW